MGLRVMKVDSIRAFRHHLAYIIGPGPRNCYYVEAQSPYTQGWHSWSFWPPFSMRKRCRNCGETKGMFSSSWKVGS